MTYEELKAEAKAQGYNLVKIPPKVPFMQCVCGRGRRSVGLWHSPMGQFFKCDYCGFSGGYGKNERKAKIAWNQAIEAAHKEKGDTDNGLI